MTIFHSNKFVHKFNVSEAFVGVNMTEPIVEHFRKYDNSDSDCEEDYNILDLLGKSQFTLD